MLGLFLVIVLIRCNTGQTYSYSKCVILSFKNNGSLSRELQGIFPRNLIHDPQHTLDGMLVLRCFFCNTFQTTIEYDMRVHLLEAHRKKLVTDLPLRGKGFNMNYRTRFAIDIMKRMRPLVFYNHRTAKFVSSDKSEM
jgi:hypothetical protein